MFFSAASVLTPRHPVCTYTWHRDTNELHHDVPAAIPANPGSRSLSLLQHRWRTPPAHPPQIARFSLTDLPLTLHHRQSPTTLALREASTDVPKNLHARRLRLHQHIQHIRPFTNHHRPPPKAYTWPAFSIDLPAGFIPSHNSPCRVTPA